MRDLVNNISPVISLSRATRTADAQGTGVDVSQYDGAMIFVITGTITDGSHPFRVDESDDNSSWAAAPASSIVGTQRTVVAADDNTFFRWSYVGTKRYIRVSTAGLSGVTSGGTYEAWVLRGHPRHAPV